MRAYEPGEAFAEVGARVTGVVDQTIGVDARQHRTSDGGREWIAAEGAAVTAGGKRAVVDGPFTETKELVAGFWIWQVRSMEEAVEWARRCPDPMPGEDAELELRPVFENEDFGAEFTPELRAQEDRLRAEIEKQQKKA